MVMVKNGIKNKKEMIRMPIKVKCPKCKAELALVFALQSLEKEEKKEHGTDFIAKRF